MSRGAKYLCLVYLVVSHQIFIRLSGESGIEIR